MGTLRIRFVVTRKELVPTFYELQGSAENATKDVYYNVARKDADMGNFDQVSLWCARKLDFSGMANNETKNVLGRWTKGQITNVKDNTIVMSANALQAVTWSDHLIIQLYSNATINVANVNSTRQKLPQYLLVSDLTQLKENVHFYFCWGDNINTHTGSLNGKFLDISLNLYNQDGEMANY